MYGITAVRFATSGASRIEQVLMGLLTENRAGWELPPAPIPLKEVIDRLLEGDSIVAVREEPTGHFTCSAPAALQVQDSQYDGWEESIAFPPNDRASDAPGLGNLPHF